MRPSHLRLGATLYVPATRPDMVAVANGDRLPFLRSVIICTEDSVHPRQVDAALDNLRLGLPQIREPRPLVFIRPRSPAILGRLLAMRGIDHVDGFVLPKSTVDSVAAYAAQAPARFLLMPTLETREVFDPPDMAALRESLDDPDLRARILALRVGGNDILNHLGVRRRPGRTIYETAAGPVVARLVATFKPHGFPLTAPVFDDFGDLDTLQEEVWRDLEHGLVGKTAIHPCQVAPIEREYRVRPVDLDAARQILDPDAQAVFQVNRVMCEPATHTTWARTILDRAAIYGTEDPDAQTQDAPLGPRLALP